MEIKKIFISYSRRDANEFAVMLANDLRKERFDVWLDQSELYGGNKFNDEIEKALEASNYVVFIVSEKALTSSYIKMRSIMH